MPTPTPADPFDLQRFVTSQEGVYEVALAEIRRGQKRSHWMWFIFPQIAGLGHSETARYFAITSLAEAQAYLAHPVLGPRLAAAAEAVLGVEGRPAEDIFGYPDVLKLQSSMTLFGQAAGPGSVYARVLDKYFAGERDSGTLRLLGM